MADQDMIPFAPPVIGEEEINEVVDTLRSMWITTGPKTRQFEEDFRIFLDAPAALAVNSCTAALHTALVALGIGTGDEVITTPLTFAATANVIEQVGAKPVLADVEPDTLNINPDAIAHAITPRTRALLPVHYAGHPVELDTIRALARQHELWLVEDAAHALPAKYRGERIGAGSNPVAFSFYATKNMTTAEGGMLTGTVDFLEQARVISLHGMNRDAWKRYDKGGSWYYEVTLPGFKYNMADLQAALGIWQLKKLPQFQQHRRQVVARYMAAFADLDEVELPVEHAEVEHAWHLFVLRLRPGMLRISREQFIEELAARGVGSSVHFIPIHLHPFYRDKYGYRPEAYPIALANYQRMLSLPLNARLSDAEVETIIGAVRDIVTTYRQVRLAA